MDGKDKVDSVEKHKGDTEPRKECSIVQLEQRGGGVATDGGGRIDGDDQAADGGGPAGSPAGKDAPIEAGGVPVVGRVRTVEVGQLDPLVADEVVVANHDAHERREEDGEGAEDGDESGGAVDELPGLDDPGCEEGDDGAAADVDVSREDASQVDAAGDGVATDVLEKNGKCEGEG